MKHYISLRHVARYDGGQFVDLELDKWIKDNLDLENRNFTKWGSRNKLEDIVGIYVDADEATFLKLKFRL